MAVSFEIERRPVGGTYALVATVTGDARAWRDRGLSPGTRYEYRLRAVDPTAGPGAYSAEVTVTTAAAPPVAVPAPAPVTATALGPDAVELAWQWGPPPAPPPPSPVEFFVATNGSVAGKGTAASPWDLSSVFGGGHSIPPGATVRLAAGTYRKRPGADWEVRALVGTAAAPIHLRPAEGARVRIDGGLHVYDPTAYVYFWDLEVFVSEPKPAATPETARPAGGVELRGGKGCRYINLHVHDCWGGIGFWREAIDSELYGCILHDNGWGHTTHGKTHACYTQNETGTKRLTNCIMAHSASFLLHGYGEGAGVRGYEVRDSIFYGKPPKIDAWLLGGVNAAVPNGDYTVVGNSFYSSHVMIGNKHTGTTQQGVRVRNNVEWQGWWFVEGPWEGVVQEGNQVVHGHAGDTLPSVPLARVYPHAHTPGRAHIAVFNWRKATTPVNVTLPEGVLQPGDRYRLLDPRDLYGTPRETATYTGAPIPVSVGAVEFAARVLLKG